LTLSLTLLLTLILTYGTDKEDGGFPYSTGLSLLNGGRPEETEDIEKIALLEKSRLYFINWHYQGGGNKDQIIYDVCRILLFSGKKGPQYV
jgi:hypothetical protein